MRSTFASYQPSQFALDVSNLGLTTAPGTQHIKPDVLPAFVHEYCHYLQDVTTISGIFGFYLWMYDVVGLTQLFSQGESEIKYIPLDSSYGEMRSFYLIYCGTGQLELNLPIDQAQIEKIEFAIELVPLKSGTREIARNTIIFKSKLAPEYHFGLMPLQETHSFYAQQYRESLMPGAPFQVPTSSLMTLPYHLGDLLFAHHGIQADTATKFLLTGLALDSIQAPTVFLKTLEVLANRALSWKTDSVLIKDTVNQVDIENSHDKEDFLREMVDDMFAWSQDTQRKYLAAALKWYLKTILLVDSAKAETQTSYFDSLLAHPAGLARMVAQLPPPILLDNGITMSYWDKANAKKDQRYEEAFQAASTIRSHWMLYNLLTARTVDEINKKCSCPLYDGCEFREKINLDYYCKTAPWQVVKDSGGIVCPYGMATHSFGLWQNELEVRMDD
ncbi:hypothetical protein [Hymenobacter sp. BRD67]|uniref:hypothetical protein n=1 Tax=Hymenobacter sp. BRD67 TaxID=2675877 RepID=UPI001565D21F|nr:hypothetical protein [Hymenobacter sp. BRD67]QKG54947.1 hypothetical protein GKZ67_21210 [Hymenobacter sp. BRD67]